VEGEKINQNKWILEHYIRITCLFGNQFKRSWSLWSCSTTWGIRGWQVLGCPKRHLRTPRSLRHMWKINCYIAGNLLELFLGQQRLQVQVADLALLVPLALTPDNSKPVCIYLYPCAKHMSIYIRIYTLYILYIWVYPYIDMDPPFQDRYSKTPYASPWAMQVALSWQPSSSQEPQIADAKQVTL